MLSTLRGSSCKSLRNSNGRRGVTVSLAGSQPRGLDHFVVTITGSKMTIDTTLVVTGPPIGTDTTSQGAEGPPCV